MTKLRKQDRVRVIGWDLDQTLYPKSHLIDNAIRLGLYEVVAKTRNISIGDAKTLFDKKYSAHGKGEAVFIELGIPDAENLYQYLIESADLSRFLKPDDATNATLKTLRQRFQQDLITGSPKQCALSRLSSLGIKPNLFEHMIFGDSVQGDTKLHKVGGDAFKFWLQQYPELQPEQFVYVGDRITSDYLPARDLGIQTVLIYQKEPPSTDAPTIAHPSDILYLLDVN